MQLQAVEQTAPVVFFLSRTSKKNTTPTPSNRMARLSNQVASDASTATPISGPRIGNEQQTPQAKILNPPNQTLFLFFMGSYFKF
ncbi:hypothetical protein DUE52_23615 [Larkinella punicea]|uniref:Uncharacterized protein n=1 Tax=Larkinella punicea TaxID=2315727 RepID=A0A368JHA0_9BACT|nr:hypothetical protein DUE52_23615 [Larkinella punicea]